MKHTLILLMGFLVGSLMSKTNFSLESTLLCIVWVCLNIIDFIEWVKD